MDTAYTGAVTSRTYGQYCPIAHALDVVGDRWNLLILRELSFGPQRFTDLRSTLASVREARARWHPVASATRPFTGRAA